MFFNNEHKKYQGKFGFTGSAQNSESNGNTLSSKVIIKFIVCLILILSLIITNFLLSNKLTQLKINNPNLQKFLLTNIPHRY